MTRLIEGLDRSQTSLLPACIDDYVGGDHPVRAIDAFVGMLDLGLLGFDVIPDMTGRPGYHPATLLKIYLYGYLNQVQSSRRLERECSPNLELIWLTGQLKPDFTTSQISGATTVQRSAESAGNSSRSVGKWIS